MFRGKRTKWDFRAFKFQNFPGAECQRTPLENSTRDFRPILCSPPKPCSDSSRRVAYQRFYTAGVATVQPKMGVKHWRMKYKLFMD